MAPEDKTLTCRDCGNTFSFTASEQDFYAARGFTNEPSRCPDCRAAHKQAQGGSRGGSRFDRPPRPMYPATCADCGAQTEVPFLPRDDRPVYCSDCYRQHSPRR